MILGGRGVRGQFSLIIFFLTQENASYQNFFRNEIFLFLAEVIAFWNLKITYNYIARATSIAIPQKSTLKSIFSYNFWGRPLKLRSYVLGTKTKILSEPIFDLGLTSKYIKFWKCPPLTLPKMKNLKFQNSIFSLQRPNLKVS